jgi:ABC-type anion transport system duplicated permease subunit
MVMTLNTPTEYGYIWSSMNGNSSMRDSMHYVSTPDSCCRMKIFVMVSSSDSFDRVTAGEACSVGVSVNSSGAGK